MSNYYCSGGCPLSTPKKEASATTPITKPKVTTVSEKAAKCTFAAVKEVKTEGKNDTVPPPGGPKIEAKDAAAAAVKEEKIEGKNDQVPPPGRAKIESKDAAGKGVKTEGKNDHVPPPGGAKIEAKDAAGAVQVEEVKATCTCE